MNPYSKLAGTPRPSLKLSGRLIGSQSGWVLLEVPNAVVRGFFAALDVPGIELPPGSSGGGLRAHISVMRKDEVDSIGGLQKITELGKHFYYQVGELQEVKTEGWEDIERAWFLSARSPELEKLRKSYGLTPEPERDGETYHFHITVAVRRKGVLRSNETSKAAGVFDTVYDMGGATFDSVKGEFGMAADLVRKPWQGFQQQGVTGALKGFNNAVQSGMDYWQGGFEDTANSIAEMRGKELPFPEYKSPMSWMGNFLNRREARSAGQQPAQPTSFRQPLKTRPLQWLRNKQMMRAGQPTAGTAVQPTKAASVWNRIKDDFQGEIEHRFNNAKSLGGAFIRPFTGAMEGGFEGGAWGFLSGAAEIASQGSGGHPFLPAAKDPFDEWSLQQTKNQVRARNEAARAAAKPPAQPTSFRQPLKTRPLQWLRNKQMMRAGQPTAGTAVQPTVDTNAIQ